MPILLFNMLKAVYIFLHLQFILNHFLSHLFLFALDLLFDSLTICLLIISSCFIDTSSDLLIILKNNDECLFRNNHLPDTMLSKGSFNLYNHMKCYNMFIS